VGVFYKSVVVVERQGEYLLETPDYLVIFFLEFSVRSSLVVKWRPIPEGETGADPVAL
jgi:hypothetical protein